MPNQLHSVTELDFQPDVALHPSPADWLNHFVYSLTGQTTFLASEQGP